ncbi:tyrosine-type recombinase/integrase [Streptomyces noursei]
MQADHAAGHLGRGGQARRRPPSPGARSRSEGSSRTPSSRTSPHGPRRSGCSRWRRGEPLNYSRWKTEWRCARKALQKAENEAAEREGRRPVERPHMVTHDLRHFHAAALIAGGASVKQVQLVLGHASAVIALRIYVHLWPGEEDRTRSVMDAVLGGLRTGCGQGDAASKETAGQTA